MSGLAQGLIFVGAISTGFIFVAVRVNERAREERVVQSIASLRQQGDVKSATKRRAEIAAADAKRMAAETPVEAVKPERLIFVGDRVLLKSGQVHGRVLQYTPPLFLIRIDATFTEARFFRDEIEQETSK